MNAFLPLWLAAVLSGVSLTALFLVLTAFFPGLLEETRRAAVERSGRAFLVGLVNLVFLTAVALALSSVAEAGGRALLQVMALLILAALLVALLLGLAGTAELLGERLAPGATGARRTIWGSLALILASLTPFIGWFGVFPALSALGLGSLLLGWIERRRLGGQGAVEASGGS